MSWVPLKYLAGINERSLPETTDDTYAFRYLDISSVGRGHIVSEPVEMHFGSAPSRARRLVRKGDTIVSTVRTYLRAVLPIRDDTAGLVASTGFAVLTPKRIESRYFAWWVQSDLFIEEVVARSVGVSYPAINATELGELRLRVPPEQEQRAIADYLDAETARIDALVAKKQTMVGLLIERNAQLVDDCFGPRPGDRLVRLGRLAEVRSGVTLNASAAMTGEAILLPYLRVANVQPGRLDLSEIKEIDVEPATALRCRLVPGDVLMTEGGDIDKLGRGTVWRGEIEHCLHQNHVFAVRPQQGVLDSDFLAFTTQTSHARRYFESTGVQSTNLASTNSFKVADLRIRALTLTEQIDRCDAYRRAAAPIAAASDRLARQIELLAEHRQALITASVTGQITVPGAA